MYPTVEIHVPKHFTSICAHVAENVYITLYSLISSFIYTDLLICCSTMYIVHSRYNSCKISLTLSLVFLCRQCHSASTCKT